MLNIETVETVETNETVENVIMSLGKLNNYRTIKTADRTYFVDFSRSDKEGLISIFIPSGPDGTLKHVTDVDVAKMPDPRSAYSSFRNKVAQVVRDIESPNTIHTLSTRTSQFMVDLALLQTKKLAKVMVMSKDGNFLQLAEIKCNFTEYDRKSRYWLISQLAILETYLKARSVLEKSAVKVSSTATAAAIEHTDKRRSVPLKAVVSKNGNAKAW